MWLTCFFPSNMEVPNKSALELILRLTVINLLFLDCLRWSSGTLLSGWVGS